MDKALVPAAESYYKDNFSVENTSDELTLLTFNENDRQSSMAFYHIMPGIDVVYNKFDTKHCIEADYKPESLNMIEINHCRQGRYGCMIDDRMFYLGVNEAEANILGVDRVNPEFPLGYYEGIEILIDVKAATDYLSPLFPDIAEQVVHLYTSLKSGRNVLRIKNTHELNHIFDELYNVNSAVQISYIKLKTLEILLELETISTDNEPDEKRYYRKSDYAKIKNLHHEVINNLDKKMTLTELSEKYGIGLTSLKNCFKEIYGCPYYTYIKRYKMHKAVHYLDETDYTIGEIAGMLGYDNTSKFISAFKSIIKCTPRQYKNKNVRLEHLELFGVEIE